MGFCLKRKEQIGQVLNMYRYGLSVGVDGQQTSANTFKHHHNGAGEMALWIKYLSLKHEDISPNPQQPCRKSSVMSHAWIPVAGLEVHQPVSKFQLQ